MSDGGLDFAMEFARLSRDGLRESTTELGPGQCCVVPVGADHRGTSRDGAEVILFTALAP